MGKAERTEEDGAFRAQIDTFRTTRTTYEDLVRSTRAYTAKTSEASAAGNRLADIFLTYGASNNDSALGAALLRYGEMMKELEMRREQLASEMTERLLIPAQAFLEGEIKETREVKNSYNRLRLEHDAVLNDYTAAQKKGGKKLQQVEPRFEAIHSRFEQTHQEVSERCANVEARKDYELLAQATEFVDAQRAYHQETSAKISELESYLQSLQRELHEAAME
eukprot:gnl/Trimastix_PCT/1275.p2 GENE.gnl/Trimastix_PCT/1275~~gnl/Trimastix_PCT/1275.p2  ORF type:complete len:259 (-),score=56.58 gnl/Trimastix_PCT/1275:1554-2219(-)